MTEVTSIPKNVYGMMAIEFNRKYPNCTVGNPSAIGNGWCDGGQYNTEDSLSDGDDCDEFTRKYPNCKVEYPWYIGNGLCTGGEYSTEECDWDNINHPHHSNIYLCIYLVGW